MTFGIFARAAILGLAAYSAVPTAAFGQSTTTPYKTVMDKPHDNVPGKVGADLGEQYNMYTGTLQFRQVDFELKGTANLPIVIARKLETGTEQPFLMYRPIRQFGDWLLETPRIWATVPPPRSTTPQNNIHNSLTPGSWQAGELMAAAAHSPGYSIHPTMTMVLAGQHILPAISFPFPANPTN